MTQQELEDAIDNTMMAVRMTQRECRLFRFLAERGTATLDEIQLYVTGSRHSLIVRIKYLAAKIAPHGWIINNDGNGQGRGKKAVYTLKKVR